MSQNNTEVLRQFLVSLGFRVDEIQQRKFESSVKKADAAAMAMGKTLMATAAGAQALLVGFANSFEKLYYLSQRTGTSAADIKAAGAAGKQIGLNAEAIESAIANISRAVKSDPGTQALIEGLTGKSTQGRGFDKVLQDVVRSLSKFPDFVAFDMAGSMGIDPDTYLQLKNNLDEYVLAQEKNRQMQRAMGVDMDKQAEVLKKYKQELSDLSTKLELVSLKFAERILPAFESLAKYTSQALDGVSKLIDLFDKPHPFGQVSKAPAPKTRPKNPLDYVLPESWVSYLFHGDSSVVASEPALPLGIRRMPNEASRAAPLTGMAGTRGQRNNNPGNLEYGPFTRSMGAIGSDGRFAIFPDMQTGTNALSALMRSYQSRGFNTVGSIVGRYAPAGENDVSAYTGFLSNYLGVDKDTRLNSSSLNSLVRGISLYESRFDPSGAGITIQQENNITVSGTDDPALTGRAVVDAQQRVNADLTRNLKGAIR